MKKYMLVFGITAFILMGLASVTLAAEENAFTKFGRGMANIVISPGEFYTQPWLLGRDHDAPTAVFGGLLKGLSMFVAREAVGVYEVITFPFPIPKGYQPIIEPPTTFTDWAARARQI